MAAKLQANVALHNEFTIEVIDIRTGKVRQTAKAYNLVLNTMFTRLVNFQPYFANIAFGTGIGALDVTRTALFTPLGSKVAADVTSEIAQMKDIANNNISWKRFIQIMPEEFVGSTLTEVGIAYSASSIVTHALIQDAEGNPIPLTKLATDMINIYATVYVTVSTQDPKVQFCGQQDNSNVLINYLVGNSSFPTQYFRLGRGKAEGLVTPYDYPILPCNSPQGGIASSLGASAAITWTKDVANKKVTTPLLRIDINTANGDVWEVSCGGSDASGLFRGSLPIPGVYTGVDVTDDAVAMTDGVTSTFTIAKNFVQNASAKVNGVVTSPTTKQRLGSLDYYMIIDNCCMSGKISPDGNYLFSYGYNTSSNSYSYRLFKKNGASFSIYPVTSVPYLTTTLTGYPVGPDSGNYGIGFSPDSTYLALGASTLVIFKRSGDVFTALSGNIDVQPAGQIYDCQFSPDGNYLAVTSVTTPYITIYKRTGDNFVKLANPAILPIGAAKCLDFSSDGVYLVVSHATTPFITIYKRAGDTFTKLTNPVTLPNGYGGCSFSSDVNYLAVATGTTPFIYIYKRSGDVFTKLDNPSTLPTGANNCLFSIDDEYLFMVCSTKATIYSHSGDTFTKLLDTTILSDGNYVLSNFLNGNGVLLGSDRSRDGSYTGANYYFGALAFSLEKNKTDLVFSTPPGLITGEAVGAGNGTTTAFQLDSFPVIVGTPTLYADGTVIDAGLYTLTLATGAIVFTTAPATGAIITADYKAVLPITANYHVDYIPKSTQYVIDLQFTLQFGVPA